MRSPDFKLEQALCTPSFDHWLGCDAFGRDLLHLTLSAASTSILFTLLALALSYSLSLVFSSVTLALPQKSRGLLLHTLEFLLGFPSILLALAVAAIRGPGIITLLISLSLGILPSLARLMILRGIEVQTLPYYEAARALGATAFRLVTRYDLPEILQLAKLKLPGYLAHTILAEASLSFLGVGAPVGHETWGSLLAQGKDYLIEAPQIAWTTGTPLFLLILWIQLKSEPIHRNSEVAPLK